MTWILGICSPAAGLPLRDRQQHKMERETASAGDEQAGEAVRLRAGFGLTAARSMRSFRVGVGLADAPIGRHGA